MNAEAAVAAEMLLLRFEWPGALKTFVYKHQSNRVYWKIPYFLTKTRLPEQIISRNSTVFKKKEKESFIFALVTSKMTFSHPISLDSCFAILNTLAWWQISHE